jgi:hypothetical protein
MSDRPTLYVGVAAPLVEQARLWLVQPPPPVPIDDRLAQARSLLSGEIGAYDFATLHGAMQSPQAFVPKRLQSLRNYTAIVPETADDPWWALWKRLQASDEFRLRRPVQVPGPTPGAQKRPGALPHRGGARPVQAGELPVMWPYRQVRQAPPPNPPNMAGEYVGAAW